MNMAYLNINTIRNVKKIAMTPEEIQFQKNKYPDHSAVASQKLSCTVCGISMKHRLVTENNVHPVLKVLMCQKCNHFYCRRYFGTNTTLRNTTNFCSWCAKDRCVATCIGCTNKFCKDCIHRNTTVRNYSSMLSDIENKKWKCVTCDTKPIWPQRALCNAAVEYNKAMTKQLEQRRSTMRTSRSSESMTANRNTAAESNQQIQPEPSAPPLFQQEQRRSTMRTTRSSESMTVNPSRNTGISTAAAESNQQIQLEPSATPFNSTTVQCNPPSAPQPEKEVDKSVSKSVDNFYKDKDLDEKKCVICLEEDASIVLYRCGHVCLCSACVQQLMGRERRCPLCRSIFVDAVTVYF